MVERTQRLRVELGGGVREPVIVLLTHARWGMELQHGPNFERLRGLFVQFPGQELHPVWADRCERWECLGAEEHQALPDVLARLLR